MKIDVSDIPGNSMLEKSRAARAETTKQQIAKPVAKGKLVEPKTKTKLSDIFTKEDTDSVISFVFTNLVMPRVKVLVVDAIDAFARAIFLGERASSEPRRNRTVEYTSYQGYYSGNSVTRVSPKPRKQREVRAGNSFDDILVDSYGDAQLILDQLDEVMDSQKYVTVSDLYEAASLPCPFTGNYYGWDNISSAKILTEPDGYRISMPPVRALKD